MHTDNITGDAPILNGVTAWQLLPLLCFYLYTHFQVQFYHLLRRVHFDFFYPWRADSSFDFIGDFWKVLCSYCVCHKTICAKKLLYVCDYNDKFH